MTRRTLIGLLVTVGFACWACAAALGQAPASPPAPINDNYLESLNLNQPGKPLDRVDTLKDDRDTTNATTQTDLFTPKTGGGAEVTTCDGTSYGKTIWYDFYPDTNGVVRIRTSAAFSTAITVLPFSLTTDLPQWSASHCVINATTNQQDLYVTVKAHEPYTVQIGGVNGAGGPLEVLFDYVVNPVRLRASATLTAQPTATGVRLVNLAVSASKGSTVTVSCTRGCPTYTRTAPKLSLPGLRNRTLNAGAELKIYATKPGAIGAYIAYKVKRGGFTKIEDCLEPGSRLPRQSC
ncbi:MAG TPA: hypothetical protein VG165_17035 [Solirubrobacteraceae bacterium]|jgi:hypothetical protein|nr:hypothetical protein [Solirubrobacteraceae bacterium]